MRSAPYRSAIELARALVELEHGRADAQPVDDVRLEAPRRRPVGLDVRDGGLREEDVVDAATRDPEQPGDRLSLAPVVRAAVAERALERVARRVLRVGTVAEAVGRVRVDAPDQRLGMRERIDADQLPDPVGSSGSSRWTFARAAVRARPVLAFPTSSQSRQSLGLLAIAFA